MCKTANKSDRKRKASSGPAAETALRFLARRDHSREELKRKLLTKGFAPAEVETTLGELEARHLLDDFRYARRLAFSLVREKLLGPQRISRQLYHKGIPADLAEEAMNQAEADLPVKERLQELLRMKLKGRLLEQMTPREKRHLANAFRQRGFLWEDILQTLQESGGFTEE